MGAIKDMTHSYQETKNTGFYGDRETATLTPRQKEIVQMLLRGKKHEKIGKDLSISHKTVDTHINNIYKKIGIHRRAELALWANKNPMLPLLGEEIPFNSGQQERCNHNSNAALTLSEADVLRRMLRGDTSTKGIAGELNLSLKTIYTHIYNMFKKVGVHSRTELVQWGLNHFKDEHDAK